MVHGVGGIRGLQQVQRVQLGTEGSALRALTRAQRVQRCQLQRLPNGRVAARSGLDVSTGLLHVRGMEIARAANSAARPMIVPSGNSAAPDGRHAKRGRRPARSEGLCCFACRMRDRNSQYRWNCA